MTAYGWQHRTVASGWLRRLRGGWFPYVVVLAALLLTPIAAWLGKLAAVRQYRDAPPRCYGLGWGCELSPNSSAVVAALSYALALVATLVVVGLLHLGGRRLALVRSIVSVGAVALLWTYAVLATWLT